MTRLRVLIMRLRGVFRKAAADERLNEEIGAHLDELSAQFRRQGLDHEEARAAARRAFGGVEQTKALHRDQRSIPSLDSLAQDLRYALRGLRRTPGFTLVAILTLAVGIGANAAMFSVADALVLRPLAVERPEQLRAIYVYVDVQGRREKAGTFVAFPWFESLREHSNAFAGITAFSEIDELTLEAAGRTIRAGGAVFATDNYFSLLGVAPQFGRTFVSGDEPTAAPAPLVLSDRFWRREFGGDRAVLGTSVDIGHALFTIVGVLPPDFTGVVIGRTPDVFLPIGTFGTTQPEIVSAASSQFWNVRAVGRLERNVDDNTTAGRLTTHLRAHLAAQNPALPPITAEVIPVDSGLSDLRTRFLRPVQVLMLMVGLLLIIASVNVSMMLLSRGVTRRSELAIRLAIGAGSRRLLQQLLTEGLVLGLTASAAGLLIAWWSTDLLESILRDGYTLSILAVIDRRVLLFTAAVSIAATMLIAIVPAIGAVRVDATSFLSRRERGATTGGAEYGGPLVVAQIALSLLILAGAALLVRTLFGLARIDPGFDTQRVMVVDVNPGARNYPAVQLNHYYPEVLARLQSTAGVESATMTQFAMLGTDRTSGTLEIPGSTLPDEERYVQVIEAGPHYFEALHMPVLEGRDFGLADMENPGTVVAINERAARLYFGGRGAIGETIRIGGDRRIVAVVADARYNKLREPAGPTVFLPYTVRNAGGRARPRLVFIVRGAHDAGTLVSQIEKEVRAIDPLVPVRATRLVDIKDRSLAQERILALISGFFAVTALLLLGIGLFGLVSFKVRQRTAELGVRLALGAHTAQVIWLVLKQPLKLALIGIAIGVPGALKVAHLLSSLLFGLTPGDAPTLVASAVGVLLIVTIGALWPAWHASRLDPLAALRQE